MEPGGGRGCLVYNIVGDYGGELHAVVECVYATIGSVFQVVYAFDVKQSMNTVVVAQKIATGPPTGTAPKTAPTAPWVGPLMPRGELIRRARALAKTGQVNFPSLATRVGQLSRFHGHFPTTGVYTDNYAPVDIAAGRRR